jgi:hypothetical protein
VPGIVAVRIGDRHVGEVRLEAFTPRTAEELAHRIVERLRGPVLGALVGAPA